MSTMLGIKQKIIIKIIHGDIIKEVHNGKEKATVSSRMPTNTCRRKHGVRKSLLVNQHDDNGFRKSHQ